MNIEDASDHICLTSTGALKYESIFERDFKGDFSLLMSCIEDNVINDSTIDWPSVEKDYIEAVKMRKDAGCPDAR